MKRFHVHVAVSDLREGVAFYSKLFGTGPSVQKPDYAKWMVEDPRLNFAISSRGSKAGINHLGFQLDSDAEFRAMRGQLAQADAGLVEETGANCCYAKSDKYWVTDPAGIAWETYHTLGSIPMFGAADDASAPCCGTAAGVSEACCAPASVDVAEPTEPVAARAACCAPQAVEASRTTQACCAPQAAEADPSRAPDPCGTPQRTEAATTRTNEACCAPQATDTTVPPAMAGCCAGPTDVASPITSACCVPAAATLQPRMRANARTKCCP